jgi:hypothetical protein
MDIENLEVRVGGWVEEAYDGFHLPAEFSVSHGEDYGAYM